MLLNDIDMNDAKMKELESWRENKVYHEVPHRNQKCFSTRWVHSFKTVNNSLVPKARLVARGFEEYCQDIQKDSPTCAHESLRPRSHGTGSVWSPYQFDKFQDEHDS